MKLLKCGALAGSFHMIAGLVLEDDEHWQLFQILLEITDLVVSQEVTN